MFFDFYPTLLKCAKLINGFRCFPLLYMSWFNWLLIHCLSFHWFLSQRKPCEGDEFCPYPFYPVPLPPEGQQSDQTHQPNTNSNANPNSNGNIGKKNLIRPKPGKNITLLLMMNKTPTYWLKICLTRGVRETTVSPNTTTSHDLPQIVLWKWKMPSKTQINLLTTFIKLNL